MTTIAYKDGYMACDSAWCETDHMLVTRRSKIVRLASGGLIGSAGDGDSRAIEELFAKAKTPQGLPSRKQLLELQVDYAGIVVLPKGRIFHIYIDEPEEHQVHWSAGLFEIAENYHAIGSGKAHALTAMECGKSAKDAVYFACRRDRNSCTPVHVMALVPKLIVQKRKAKA